MSEDTTEALTPEELSLLKTVRELAPRLSTEERRVLDAAVAAMKAGRAATVPAPQPRPRLGLKDQEEIIRLAAELAYMWDRVNPDSAGEQVRRFLRAAIDAERLVRQWLLLRGHDFLRAGGFFRVLAPLLRDHLQTPSVFSAPSVGWMFAGLMHLRTSEDEPGAFDEVAKVLAPRRPGKRKPFVERSIDRTSLSEFRRHLRNLRALERRTRGAKSVEEIHDAAAASTWERNAPFPPCEHADAVARYRTRRNTLRLEQLAALIWKTEQNAPAMRTVPLAPYQKTMVATASDEDAEAAMVEISRIAERVKRDRRRGAVSRRKRPSS